MLTRYKPLGDDVNRLRKVEWAAAEAEDVAVPEAVAALVRVEG
jgi:hypothetical protein